MLQWRKEKVILTRIMKQLNLKTAVSMLLSLSLLVTGVAIVHAKRKSVIFFPTHDVSVQKMRENQSKSKQISKLTRNLADNHTQWFKHPEPPNSKV
jgi:hypothetical protein